MKDKNKLLIVCGPTATGKTKLALSLARKFNGELISADSRQVYKGMDIGTGKDIAGGAWVNDNGDGHWEINNTPIWLLDVVLPNEEFSISHYKKLVDEKLDDINTRKKLPIIVGGTGLYIKAVTENISTINIPQNSNLRKSLDLKSPQELFSYLKNINPEKANNMNNSDKNNPRRLVRAIEVADFKNKHKQTLSHRKKQELDTLFIGLTTSTETIFKKISQRINKRIDEGIVEEARTLIKNGVKWSDYSMTGLGYRQWKPFFENKTTLENVIKQWTQDEQNYAKRQLTWFKKDKRINWFDVDSNTFHKEIENKVCSWLNS